MVSGYVVAVTLNCGNGTSDHVGELSASQQITPLAVAVVLLLLLLLLLALAILMRPVKDGQ